jgi:hypothetical protein
MNSSRPRGAQKVHIFCFCYFTCDMGLRLPNRQQTSKAWCTLQLPRGSEDTLVALRRWPAGFQLKQYRATQRCLRLAALRDLDPPDDRFGVSKRPKRKPQ